MTSQATETFRTCDVATAAYLIYQHCVILKTEMSGRKVFFHFLDPQLCEDLAQKVRLGKALVNALDYSNAIKNVKQIVFAEQRVFDGLINNNQNSTKKKQTRQQ